MMSSLKSVAFFFLLVGFSSPLEAMIVGECQAPNEWKTWLNVHRPTAYGTRFDLFFIFGNLFIFLGEFELVSHYQTIFAGQSFICSKPTGLEVKTMDDRQPSTTGDTFRFTLTEGFYCFVQLLIPRKKLCTDYKIKFCCSK